MQASIQTQGGYDQLTYSLLSGDLPEGVTLDSNSGTIAGTPLEGGAFPITVGVSDGCLRGIQQVQASYTLNVECDCNPVAITTSSLPAGQYGESYNEIIETQGGWGDIAFSLVSGQLPQGISLNPVNGAITGIPQDKIQKATRMFATTKPACWYSWNGIEQNINATQTNRALCILYALTGNFDKPGGNVILQGIPSNPVLGHDLLALLVDRLRQGVHQLLVLIGAGDQVHGAHVEAGERLGFDDGLRLADSHDLPALGLLAHAVRTRMHGDDVYYNINRHINYTNYCVLRCRSTMSGNAL